MEFIKFTLCVTSENESVKVNTRNSEEKRQFLLVMASGLSRRITSHHKSTRSSAVAERPRDASCYWIFC